jgi:hypothetical protein
MRGITGGRFVLVVLGSDCFSCVSDGGVVAVRPRSGGGRKKRNAGSLHFATDDEAVCGFGRDDDLLVEINDLKAKKSRRS